MPALVEMDSKKKRKKMSSRNGAAAMAKESTTVVEKAFTLEAAYAKHQRVQLSGREALAVGAVERDGLANATQLVQSESASLVVVRSQATVLPSEMATGLCYQDSCITDDERDSDNSGGIESSRWASSLQRVSTGNSLARTEATIARSKRKREDDDLHVEGSGVQLAEKAQKLSEEERVWQYVCNRSVLVSPPQCPQLNSGPFRSIQSQVGPSNVSDEKTQIIEVEVNDKTIRVTLTKESSVAQEWIKQQTGKYFGLDLEWQPNWHKGRPENKVALVQISNETECLLIQMLFLDSIPSALVEFLKDPERKIVGVGIHDDTKKLHRDYGLACGGEVELCTLAVKHYKNEGLKRAGLKALAKKVLGYTMTKSKSVTMSNWSKSHLNRKQIEYACMDAWISHSIFERLQ